MSGRSLAQVLAEARARLDRVEPRDLKHRIARGAIVVDVRDSGLRSQQGEMAGAQIIDLTVLEWRLAPSSEFRSIEVADGQEVILVCSEGFSSSLAAARLKDLGVDGATDLIGGFKAWKAYRDSPEMRGT